MSLKNRPILSSLLIFILLLGYFVSTYKYYPGLVFSVDGHLDSDMPLRLYWDYGKGFNNRDYVDLELSAGRLSKEKPLDVIRIEPAGFKVEESRGYLAWVVIPEELIVSESYVLDGRHHWGHWLDICKNKRGRQLALFPDAAIEIAETQSMAVIFQFKSPEAGYVKVSSVNGPVRYYNGYGLNRQWEVNRIFYKNEATGAIRSVSLPFDSQKPSYTLSHHKIENLRLSFASDQVTDVAAYGSLRLELHPGHDEGNRDFQIEDIHVNGVSIKKGHPSVRVSGNPDTEKLVLNRESDFIEFVGEIKSYDIYLAGQADLGSLHILVDGQDIGALKAVEKKKRRIVQGTAPLARSSSKVTSCVLTDAEGARHQFMRDSASQAGDDFDLPLQAVDQSQFNTLLFVVQLLLAAGLASMVCMILTRMQESTNLARERSFSENIIGSEGRWLFWVLFCVGVLVNLLYLAADWPGSMTPDSIFVHNEIKGMRITNHHPYSYSLFVLACHNIWDSPATGALVQIVTFHLLSGYFFSFLYRNGLKLYVVIPCFLLVICSFPVNLFNITSWKDVPYSTLVLFWALFVTYHYYLHTYVKRKAEYRLDAVLVLSMLFLLLISLRHNGLVYLPYIPLVLLLFCKVKVNWFGKFCIASVVLCVLYYAVFPDLVLYQKPRLNDFAKNTAAKRVGEFSQIAEEGKEYYLPDYLAKRTHRFVGTLGTSPKANPWMNDMHNPPQRWFSYDQAKADMETHPLSDSLAGLLGKIIETTKYSGLTSGRFIFWNSSFALFGLIVVFMLYKWLPLSAFYSFFFLYQSLAMYFVVWERWRYLYFIYLGGLFLLPTVAFELTQRRKRQGQVIHEAYYSDTLL